MVELSILVVFFAGMASFLSPCVISLVPAYVGFITNNIDEEQDTSSGFILKRGLFFVLGFTIIFIIMGASVGFLGNFFVRNRLIFIRISGIFIVIFGLKMLGLFNMGFLNREYRVKAPKTIRHGGDALLMGMAFATGWTPCVGPVLASVLLYVASTSSFFFSILLLLIYAMGLAIPFLITALTLNKFQQCFSKYERTLIIFSKIAAILLVLMGVLIFTNNLGILTQHFSF